MSSVEIEKSFAASGIHKFRHSDHFNPKLKEILSDSQFKDVDYSHDDQQSNSLSKDSQMFTIIEDSSDENENQEDECYMLEDENHDCDHKFEEN